MRQSILFLFVFFLVCSFSVNAEEYPAAPDFELTDLNGNIHTLSDFDGKVIFINFWATWCPPCRQEIPGFIEIYEANKDKGMVMLGISLDETGPEAVRSFIKNIKINYPVVMATMRVYQDYNPGAYIPTTFVIDKNGKIRHKHVGYLSKKKLERYFLELNGE